ncbi:MULTISPECIES: toll/interleukin-1 receptor domain-containing protein [unclassified Undibacterium]|uniref:toll/interleukin-1 receptor domain-containing protein n=1 Tax=unclassified Undibacterium TaxID=2630295 RepID=UPI002AC8E2B2|nr:MULTISPECIES: toll/interleukin-1 receptor domain-containing protein [unclassified Undibacterium]MEB0138820.1 toll/interleukin-1 receptor domain-containing protein [Undibacterium sp. CCC2.1]MEB0170704.1 toll/interleukin-1 receptor domain-containing protein [Undibacterium sp. CCC1.1]MEB0177045.1 toll/interleukin-1 receptor domain-containing protein [Undibacterium sp. CCC3.4]MEB0216334.1 toll/interleukin-1 receptor domain-containing protein [Undibacterium sp. 5I2]WPX42518.1 toll/interleukin-1 
MTGISTPVLCCPLCHGEKLAFILARKRWRCENIDCCEVFDGPPPGNLSRQQNIFLSYAHTVDGNDDHSAHLVRRIKEKLEQAGHKTWIDEQQLQPGFDWRHGITQGILASDRVLSFLSPRSVRDPGVCLDEIGIAMAHKHGAIATILTDDRTVSSIPASVSHIQYLDLADWKLHVNAPDEEPWLESKVQKILDILTKNAGFAGELEHLARALGASTTVSKIGRLIESGIVGRAWVFDAIETWRLQQINQRVFQLIGLPGTGKSAIAAHLVHYAKLRVVAYHFCEADQPETRFPHIFVRNLAFMLAARLPAFRVLLKEQLARLTKPLHELSADYLMEQLLINPLRSHIDGGQTDDRLLIVIDGLDEADISLSKLLNKTLQDLPSWLGVVMTGRTSIKPYFEQFQTYELSIDDKNNQTDLRQFMLKWAEDEPAMTSDIQEYLLHCASGQILYLVMARRAVKDGNMTINNLKMLPPGLGGCYQIWFERAFSERPTEGGVWNTLVYPLLGLLCASSMPLPIHVARKIGNWHGQDATIVRHALSGLLLWDSSLQFSHKSISDWLIETEGLFCVNVEESTQRLVDWLSEQIPDSYQRYELSDEKLDVCGLMVSMAQTQLHKKQFSNSKRLYEGVLNICAGFLSVSKSDALSTMQLVYQSGRGLLEIIQETDMGSDDLIFSINSGSSEVTLMEMTYEAFGAYIIPMMMGERPVASVSPEKLSDLTNLAIQIEDLGLSPVSERLHETVFSLREEHLGSSHIDTLLSWFIYASNCKNSQGDMSVDVQFKRKIEGLCDSLGMLSTDQLVSSVGVSLEKLFLFSKAKSVYEMFLEIERGRVGALGSLSPHCRSFLARMFYREKKFAEAKIMYEQVLLIYQKNDGIEHAESLTAMSALADIEEAIGDFISARSSYERILTIRKKVQGWELDNPANYFTVQALSRTLRALGEKKLADELDEKASTW